MKAHPPAVQYPDPARGRHQGPLEARAARSRTGARQGRRSPQAGGSPGSGAGGRQRAAAGPAEYQGRRDAAHGARARRDQGRQSETASHRSRWRRRPGWRAQCTDGGCRAGSWSRRRWPGCGRRVLQVAAAPRRVEEAPLPHRVTTLAMAATTFSIGIRQPMAASSRRCRMRPARTISSQRRFCWPRERTSMR